jgi:hypothetical protein
MSRGADSLEPDGPGDTYRQAIQHQRGTVNPLFTSLLSETGDAFRPGRLAPYPPETVTSGGFYTSGSRTQPSG